MQNITKRAIEAFRAAIKADRIAENKNRALNFLVAKIPPEELGEYIEATDAIR